MNENDSNLPPSVAALGNAVVTDVSTVAAVAGELAMEPEDLDGYSIDDLANYLDAGMRPSNPQIDASPACQTAIAALMALRRTARDLLDAAAADEPEPDDAWIRSVLENISLESRAGRSIPFHHDDAAADLQVTEGVVRALVRGAGDTVAGILVGRCRLDGDVTVLDSPVRVEIDVTVLWGNNIPDRVEELRVAVISELAASTELLITGVDITVTDVHLPRGSRFGADAR